MQVHEDFITLPLWQLILKYGYPWIHEQQAIFDKIANAPENQPEQKIDIIC